MVQTPHQRVLCLVYSSYGFSYMLRLEEVAPKAEVHDSVLRYLQQIPG